MTDSSIDALVARLRNGDAGAAEELVRTYEPFLRMVIRRQLSASQRSKFDSVDIVQSIWMDVLEGFSRPQWQFANQTQLQAFLVKIAKNRLIDRWRQQQGIAGLSQILSDDIATNDTPSQEAISSEIWTQLLNHCPPHHRPILELKRQGYKIVEIAERIGMHAGSIRRILSDLSKRYTQQSQAEMVSSSEFF
jgi:RNA polymerase sigma factor (sigma-70 family)